MRWLVFWFLVVVFTGGLRANDVSAAKPKQLFVEEWQIDGILAALKDGYPEVRVFAAREFAKLLEPDSSGKELRRTWRDNVRSKAEEAKKGLHELLKVPNLSVSDRLKSALALARLGDQEGAKTLDELLKNPKTEWDTAEALARMGYEQAEPVLQTFLKNTDPKENTVPEGPKRAAGALAILYQRKKNTQALRKLLEDPAGKECAAPALVEVYEDVKNVEELRKLLTNSTTRRDAIVALARLNDQGAEPDLRELAKEAATKKVADVALAWLSGQKAVEDLHKHPEDSAVRQEARKALNKAVDDLHKFLGDREVREVAMMALVAVYKAEKNSDALLKLLTNPSTRGRAALALGQLGKENAESDLRKLRNDPEVRRDPDRWTVTVALVKLYEALYEPTKNTKYTKALRELLKESDPSELPEESDTLDSTGDAAAALTRLGEVNSVTALNISYYTPHLYWTRWLAHYWGGKEKDPKVAKILCDYLAYPKEDPKAPKSREEARDVVNALDIAWKRSLELSMNRGRAGCASTLQNRGPG